MNKMPIRNQPETKKSNMSSGKAGLTLTFLKVESPRRSPKKESPILENRKPGRPRWVGILIFYLYSGSLLKF